jgi:putative Ca2+/H+ antiporter (TMEM165/GDT1 family)
MRTFLISLSTVAVAEMGDRTQLLSLMLAARFRRPWPILAGILCATIANHGIAAVIGHRLGHVLTPRILDAAVGASMIAMALWTLRPDSLDIASQGATRGGAFITTLIAFFVAEIGDKTQLATIALAAAYPSLPAVVAGTTAGMMLANAPAVIFGNAFAARLPLKPIRYLASAIFLALGVFFLVRCAAAP